MDEMKQRQASGEPVSFRELEERKRDLMEDEALEKMAGTLPSSPDFRRIIKRSLTGVTSKEELTRALKETFRRGGELAPERRGRHLRDCYEEQRQSAERLMNIQPVRNYRQGQAVELMANLIVLREQEQKSGSPDAPVDEQALARRVEELRKDQTVLKLAEGAILARETGKDRKVGEEAPEQLLAREVFSQYQKANPVKVPAPPEDPEAQPDEPVL